MKTLLACTQCNKRFPFPQLVLEQGELICYHCLGMADWASTSTMDLNEPTPPNQELPNPVIEERNQDDN